MVGNAIQVDGDWGDYKREEANGSGTIKPGHLLEKEADGTVKVHSTEGGRGLVQVAVEDALQGKTYLDSYTSGNKVQYNIQRPGTRFHGILRVGEKVVIGEPLISDGSGRLIALDSAESATTVEQVMAYAEEALDLTVSDAVDTHICVRAA